MLRSNPNSQTKNIRSRIYETHAKGYEMKKILLLILVMHLCDVNAQALSAKFDTKNHPKAKGVWATVRYPAGWKSKEGERPNMVQKFTGDYKGMFVVLSLQILNVGAPIEKECTEMSATEFEDALSDEQNGVRLLNAKKMKHEGKPAFLYNAEASLERVGKSITTSNTVMSLCYKRTLVSVWCSPAVINSKAGYITSTKRELDLLEPLCFQYFNSLVLMDQY